EQTLKEIFGMPRVTLQPVAGAHGELTGILMVHKALARSGNARKYILIPDSAHGTNPASAAFAGYEIKELKSNSRGTVDLSTLEAAVNEDVAALMITVPNTLGVFESEITRMADILHAKGAYLYCDGANLNSVGGMRAFNGNFNVLVRALTYMRSMGPTGLRRIAQLAVLNANYIRARLRGSYHLPYDAPTLHEVVFSDKLQTAKDVHTLDIAKRL